MKNGAMLINTSRGALIDTPAVINGLKSKKLSAVGLDVCALSANSKFYTNVFIGMKRKATSFLKISATKSYKTTP